MKKFVIANWKMNLPPGGMDAFFGGLAQKAGTAGVEIGIAPPFPYLRDIRRAIDASPRPLMLAAQNCSEHASGAYTGEVSASMIRECGGEMVIVGHSERRRYFAEADDAIGRKMAAAVRENLQPVFCIGEDEATRDAGGTDELLRRQVREALAAAGSIDRQIIVAYEPVWAIGTGRTASAEIVGEAHATIRAALREAGREGDPIIYGGSVTPDNARNLAEVPDVAGFLVGGASLDPAKFLAVEAGIIEVIGG